MYPIVKVRGVKYEKDHKNYPQYPHQAGGPLVPDPRFPSAAQEYISWKRVKAEPVPDELGRVPTMVDIVKGVGGAVTLERKPVRFSWEFDSAPVAMERTPDIDRAISRGDLEEVKESSGKGKGGK
jgi:hypothetical protein